MGVFVIGQIRVKDEEKWAEYKSKVQSTLEPYGAKILVRGSCIDSFVGTLEYPDVVIIEFETDKKAQEWYNSESYQSIVPIREKGADIILHMYQ